MRGDVDEHSKQAHTAAGAPVDIAGRASRYGWVVLGAAFLSLVMAFGAGNYTFGIFFKPVLADFGWSRGVTAVAFSLYMMGFGIFSVPMGILGDKYGPRLVTAVGGFMMGLGYVLLTRVSSLWQLYLYYGLLVGGGVGTLYGPLCAAVAGWFERRRGLALGLLMAGIGTGAVVVPTIAERVIASHGWRAAYLVVGVLCWVVIIAASFLVKRPPRGLAAAAGRVERRSLSQILATRLFWTVNIMYFLWGIVFGMVLAHLAPYASDSGMSAAAAAGVVSIMGLGSIFGRVLMGGVSDRMGIEKTFAVCFFMLIAALVWLMYMHQGWTFYAFALVFGFFYGGHIPLWPAVTGKYFGIASLGAVFGVLLLGANIGAALGSPMGGIVFDATHSYFVALAVCAIAMALALVMALSLMARRKRQT